MKPITIEKYTHLTPPLLDQILKTDKKIFDDPYPKDKILRKIEGKAPLIFLAHSESVPVGFKMGYAIDDLLFYSWMGGVLPAYRGQKIASKLMTEQHQQLKDMGFKKVRTKTRNEFKSMLLLNIKTGFEITDTYKAPGESLRIVLEKDL